MTADERNEPLKDESRARPDWRGEEAPPRPEAPGHSLPASEDQDERAPEGGAGGPAAGAFAPPD